MNLIDPYRFASAPPAVNLLVTSISGGTPRNDFTGEPGFRFNVSSTQSLVALAMEVLAGNTGSWTVNLYSITGGLTLSSVLATASVSRTGVTGAFASASITPVTLNTGTDYVLTFVSTASDGQFWKDNNLTINTTASFLTIVDSGVATNVWIPTAAGSKSYGMVNGIYA